MSKNYISTAELGLLQQLIERVKESLFGTEFAFGDIPVFDSNGNQLATIIYDERGDEYGIATEYDRED